MSHQPFPANIYFLEHPGAKIEVQRDNAGRVIGLIVSAAGHAIVESVASGTLTNATPATTSPAGETTP